MYHKVTRRQNITDVLVITRVKNKGNFYLKFKVNKIRFLMHQWKRVILRHFFFYFFLLMSETDHNDTSNKCMWIQTGCENRFEQQITIVFVFLCKFFTTVFFVIDFFFFFLFLICDRNRLLLLTPRFFGNNRRFVRTFTVYDVLGVTGSTRRTPGQIRIDVVVCKNGRKKKKTRR